MFILTFELQATHTLATDYQAVVLVTVAPYSVGRVSAGNTLLLYRVSNAAVGLLLSSRALLTFCMVAVMLVRL